MIKYVKLKVIDIRFLYLTTYVIDYTEHTEAAIVGLQLLPIS